MTFCFNNESSWSNVEFIPASTPYQVRRIFVGKIEVDVTSVRCADSEVKSIKICIPGNDVSFSP